MLCIHLLRIEIAGELGSFKNHLAVKTLSCIDHIEDALGFIHLDTVADGGKIGCVIVISAVRLLHDHGEWSALLSQKTIHEDTFCSIGNGDEPLFDEIIDEWFQEWVVK